MRTLITLIFVSSFLLFTEVSAGEGALALTTEPKEAEIFVDGQLKANSTPIILKLSEGKHLLEIKKVGKQSQSLEIVIADEAVLSKKITLADLPKSDDSHFLAVLDPKRDPLETESEFLERRQRLLDDFNQASKQHLPTYQAGTAHLSADKYDVKHGSFSVSIDWQPWATRFQKPEKNNFAVRREAAKALLTEGEQKPIFLQLIFDPNKPLLAQKPIIKEILLVGTGQEWHLDESATRNGGMAGYLKMAAIAPLAELFQPLVEAYQQKYPYMNLAIQTMPLPQALAELTEGNVHFVPMFREMYTLNDFVKKYGYKPTGFRVALNILALYVHKSNPVVLNVPQQIDAIFSSTRKCGYEQYLTSWEETWVGGLTQVKKLASFGYLGNKFSGNIEVYREENEESLDSLLFREIALCGGEFKSVPAKTTTVQGAIGRVAYNPLAITFGRITHEKSEVRTVPLVTAPLPVGYDGTGYMTDFTEPSVENAKNGNYPLASFIWIYGNIPSEKAMSPLEKAFIELALSETGQQSFKEQGLISPF